MKASHHKVNVIATSRCLELLHVNLMGHTRTESLGEKRYIMVVVDDFSRYIQVEFLREKSEACEKLEILCKKLQNKKGASIVKIRSDHRKELRMQDLSHFVQRIESKGNFQPPKLLNKMGWQKERMGDSRNGKSYATKQVNTSKVLGRSCEHLMSHWQQNILLSGNKEDRL